ncbi:leucine-rich repeat serine/threonine-protein kinase 1-like isoform X2 [Dysidea avara]|uniref:leucine-rich repeat serine/threonine-protein kinase 1-like isoform X2 n=1 Tax=Dysidea avara TaxID=196820 RepID=UPI00332C23D8
MDENMDRTGEDLTDKVPEDGVLDAVVSNKPSIVSQWLNSLPTIDDRLRHRIVLYLQQSAHSLSVDVVKLFQTPTLSAEDLFKIINTSDSNGMTAIHRAVQGFELQKGKSDYAILEVLAHLCEQGGDPTVTYHGRTAKATTEEKGNRIASALLEILENIHCQITKQWPFPQYADIDLLHKTLLHWAVNTRRHHIVSQILIMHQRDSYDSIAHLLFNNDPYSLESFQEAPIYTVVKMSDPKMFETLITYGGIPPNVIIGQKQKLIVPRPDGTNWEHFITPLSLILSIPQSSSLIDVLVDFDQSSSNCRLTNIDLSSARIDSLPDKLFDIHHLQHLDVSSNYLSVLKFSNNYWLNSLQELNLSHNSLEEIPSELFSVSFLKVLNVSHNPMTSLPDKWWSTKSIVTLDVSFTNLKNLSMQTDDSLVSDHIGSSASLPLSVISGRVSTDFEDPIAFRIKKTDSLIQNLNAANCKIEEFPGLLAVYFPNLESLNLSGNMLQCCCAINELPSSLLELDLSNNLLCFNSHKLFHRDVRLSTKSSCMRHKDLSKLRTLNLANNVNLITVNLHNDNQKENSYVFFPKLRKLNLTNCSLQMAPKYLSELKDLVDFNISNNKLLTIPREIRNLKDLMYFNYDGVQDPIANELNMFTHTKEKQIYLREDSSLRSPTVKLIFVGPEEINLPSWISDRTFQDRDHSLVVVDDYTWCISKPKSDLVINFNVWNFIGQNDQISAIQCFLTNNALYVLCWQITTDRDYGIFKLRNWLLRIKDNTKDTSVLVVGYHRKAIGHRLKRLLINQVQTVYGNQHHFPFIVNVRFVSEAKLKHDIIKLRTCLYDTMSTMEISLGTKKFRQKVMDMKIPVTYFKLQGSVSKKAACIKIGKEEGPPIQVWEEIVKLAGIHEQEGHERLFKDEADLTVAVKYMKENGAIMHFDSLGLSDYYFIDPHWLFDVFCRVHSSMINVNCKINANDSKVTLSQLQHIFEECQISNKHYKAIFKLLCRFEIAIPLDSDSFLIPSVLQNDPCNKLLTSTDCYFPCNKLPNLPLKKQFSYRGLLPAPAYAKPICRTITLHFTGMCYRRLFLAHHVPETFWRKLISRFISSANSFYTTFLNNCTEGIGFEKMANVGDAVICNNHCKWLYWSNGVTLTFGGDVLLCVNGLVQSTSGGNEVGSHKVPLSATMDKIKTMKFLNGHQWVQYFHEDIDGIEVNVPDYMIQSSIEETGIMHTSFKLGTQILAQVLEFLNEVCTEVFESNSEESIYSSIRLQQLVVCPYCYGDKLGIDVDSYSPNANKHSLAKSLQSLLRQSLCPIDVYDCVENPGKGSHGFTIQLCILKAQQDGIVLCPVHGALKLLYLTPDLVFEDITMKKIKATEVEEPVGKGGFGAVYKVKLAFDPNKHVALKCFTNLIINGKLREHSLQDLAMIYATTRLELNKISLADHPNIVQFVGLCVVSFSFLLEWAPKGNLDQVVNEYRVADIWICPDAVAKTVHQVSSALSYLHTEKNIVHFDIKPANVLVFKYPQAGHFCFSKETSLNCESCYSEGGGVLVKLADLGISALVGPSGFQRKSTTPTYAAPEVIKYSGKEPLTEKVDIYSLGILLYEVMTLRKLPPEGTSLEYGSDIIAGKRPGFLPEDPKYPLPLIECLRSCWSQKYTQRPTAKKIEEIFQSPNCLKFKNSYEIKEMAITAVLVVKSDTPSENNESKEMVWVASTSKDCYALTCYVFAKQEDNFLDKIIKTKKKVAHPKLWKMDHPISLKHPVKTMCHHGQHIWIVYDNGILAVCDVNNYTIVQDVELQEPCTEPVAMLVVDHSTGLIATTYVNGLIVFLWGKNVLSGKDLAIKYFHSSTTISISWQTFKLNTIETCGVSNGHSQLWCSYDIGVIQVVKPPVSTSGETEIVKVLEIKEYCTDLPHDTSIVQLKCSPYQDHKSSVMYALHDGGHCCASH